MSMAEEIKDFIARKPKLFSKIDKEKIVRDISDSIKETFEDKVDEALKFKDVGKPLHEEVKDMFYKLEAILKRQS